MKTILTTTILLCFFTFNLFSQEQKVTVKKDVVSVNGSPMFTLVSTNYPDVCTCTQITTTPGYSHNGQNYPEDIDVTIPHQYSYKAKKDDYESSCKKNNNFNSYESPNPQYGQAPTTVINTCEVSPF